MMSNHLQFINLAHDIALKNLGKTAEEIIQSFEK